MIQIPSPGTALRRFAGDTLCISLQVPTDWRGRAFVRTNLCGGSVARAERLSAAEEGRTPMPLDWTDLPMESYGSGQFRAQLRLSEVGLFAAKTYFVSEDGDATPRWPAGTDICLKVAPASTRNRNSIYTAFTRCFCDEMPRSSDANPRSGTFRALGRRLDIILGEMGFGIVQLLPIHPSPTVYGRMGEYGSPFAGLDFLSVDPSYAEFDPKATPMDQFRELLDGVHARGGRLFLDLPANHTGWASTLLAHHPEWFHREGDGRYHSPGAWGVVWEDLVELDYSQPGLREYMASVFEFWCAEGVDGFRCDAGYMVPEAIWQYIVDRVRTRFPETVFFLEGLGGKISVTRSLLDTAGLDWAYSEIFQTEDRSAFEHYLPGAQALSDEAGPLVHFAETHDNLRLAARSPAYSRLRVKLSALLSSEGAFGITSGVEWFATEKIDVHNLTDLRWGNPENQVAEIGLLNRLLAEHPAFAAGSAIRMIQQGDGNSLAVLRTRPEAPHAGSVLILANLDPDHAQPVNWPANAFDCATPIDLLTHAHVHPTAGAGQLRRLILEPGQVIAAAPSAALPAPALPAPPNVPPLGLETLPLSYPADLHRVIPVPPGRHLLLRAPCPFRVSLPNGPRTESYRDASGDYLLHIPPLPQAPHNTPYELALLPGRGAPAPRGGVLHLMVLGTAPKPQPRTTFTGTELRHDTQRVVLLTNGRGAMAHVRVAWPSIASRYDALLAANPDPAVPCDRWMLLSRCRLWVRRLDYSAAVDASCLERFEALPDSATWHFRVPIGLGQSALLSVRLALAHGNNAASLHFALDPSASTAVELVVRPDLESRSFHELTKAYAGPEHAWPAACAPRPHGLGFHPHGRPGLDLAVASGSYVHEPEWSYCVPLPHDAQRGQEASTDLFSPGFFRISLAPGQSDTLTATADTATPAGTPARGPRADADPRATALLDYVVARDDVSTVIAGYPWFLDWGRDTFIVLRGMIAADLKDESLAIVRAFARFERAGTLPNMIRGNDDSNRDTSDAPLWFSVAAHDLCVRYGAKTILATDCGGRTLLDVLVSIAQGYIHGTPNGIAMDPETALIFSPPHFTWMDTNFPAGTPRHGYPIEIQALWIAALRALAEAQPNAQWASLANRAAASVQTLYWLPDKGYYSDCLSPTRAPDDALRPNQLLLVTLGALDLHEPTQLSRARSLLSACSRLLIPGAIRTLDDAPVSMPLPIVRDGVLLNDPLRPYWGAYAGDEDTRRKPAYHNGTAWTWVYPSYPEALLLVYGARALPDARAYLTATTELLEQGAIGHLPEILDGNYPHAPRGCDAQAWGDSELYRVLTLLP